MSHDYALYHKSSLLYANDPRDYIPIDFYPLDVFHAQTENVYEMINWPTTPFFTPISCRVSICFFYLHLRPSLKMDPKNGKK